MCVCGTWTHLVCIHNLTHFRLTALWCGCSVVKLTYLHQTPSWLWLLWTNSPAFTSLVYRPFGTINPNSTVLSQIIVLWTWHQVCEYLDSAISKLLNILKMADHDVKLETARKAEGTEHLCFLWGTLFLQLQCYGQFWKSFNPVCIQIYNFCQTDKLTDGQNQLLNLRMHMGVATYRYWLVCVSWPIICTQCVKSSSLGRKKAWSSLGSRVSFQILLHTLKKSQSIIRNEKHEFEANY